MTVLSFEVAGDQWPEGGAGRGEKVIGHVNRALANKCVDIDRVCYLIRQSQEISKHHIRDQCIQSQCLCWYYCLTVLATAVSHDPLTKLLVEIPMTYGGVVM